MSGPFKDESQKIIAALRTKSVTKQEVYRVTHKVFERMREFGAEMADQYAEGLGQLDPDITVSHTDRGEFEFRLKLAGDLLIFAMHSNVVTFPEEHLLVNNDYVKEDTSRGFFGQIMVYNFMADTVKYNRMKDPGYMIARMLINREGHFYVEGVRQLNFMFSDLGKNILVDGLLLVFMQKAVLAALENDLMAPPFKEMSKISYEYKVKNQMIGTGDKLGFQMSTSTD